VTLTAVASAGYVFDSWSGQTEGIADLHQNPVMFVMGDNPDNNRTITANFTPSDVRYGVTAVVEPSGGGSVRFQPNQPQSGYSVNQSVTVFAEAQTGYVFSHWTGDLLGNDNFRTLLVSAEKSITAVFRPTITPYCSPYDAGSIALEPESSNGYAAGTEVTITAKAAKGYRFVSWQGDISGSKKSVSIAVDAPMTITAVFDGQSPSRWWLWVILGLTGLTGVLIILRLAYARMNRGALDEPKQPDG